MFEVVSSTCVCCCAVSLSSPLFCFRCCSRRRLSQPQEVLIAIALLPHLPPLKFKITDCLRILFLEQISNFPTGKLTSRRTLPVEKRLVETASLNITGEKTENPDWGGGGQPPCQIRSRLCEVG